MNMRGIRHIYALMRPKVALMVAVSTAFGFLLARPVSVPFVVEYGADAGVALLVVSSASFLLTAACSAFNQVQERDTDRLFTRTRNRPLVTGELSVPAALGLGIVWAAGGLALFWFLDVPQAVSWLLTGLGICIFVTYNLAYTPLKQVTPFALLVGAVPGAMPPVIGWLVAVGSGMHPQLGSGLTHISPMLFSPVIVCVYVVYYLWQVPHFWLRAERDRHEYQRAGMPIPCVVFGQERYGRLLRLWYYAYCIALLMLPVFPFMQTVEARMFALMSTVALMLGGGWMLRQRRLAFHAVNVSLLAVVLLLSADSIRWLG